METCQDGRLVQTAAIYMRKLLDPCYELGIFAEIGGMMQVATAGSCFCTGRPKISPKRSSKKDTMYNHVQLGTKKMDENGT